jgi:DNA processing protein
MSGPAGATAGEPMDDTTFDLLTLALLPDVGCRRIRELCGRGPVAEVIRRPHDHSDLLGAEARARLLSGESRRRAEAERRRAQALGVAIVSLKDSDYPQRLAHIYDPPAVLYLRGRLDATDDERSVSVVGSRKASVRGLTLARALARELATAGVTVVSGLARGTDTAAHLGALEGSGRTVAVLGSGIDRVYPPENRPLAERLVEGGGAVVSEFPLSTDPLPGHFPRRNRIIAGWSRATVVVEAASRSGALVTARSALDEGRDVLAVPGHPSQESAEGTNQLIRDGAVLVRGAADVLEELGMSAAVKNAVADEDPVLAALRNDVPSSLDELQARSGGSVPHLLARLTELEVENRVRRLPGGLFVRLL